MFDLYFLSFKNDWQYYCTKNDIQDIYRTIDILNMLGETEHYRIDIDERVFAYLDNSKYQLEYMMQKFDTNEKCKPRFTCDEYEVSYTKTKKKGRR